MARSLIGVLFLFALARAEEPSPCPESPDILADLKKMQGKWELIKALRNGKGRGKDTAGVVMVVEKNSFTVKDGNRDEVIKIKLNGKKKPPEIDLTPKAGKMLPGVYKLEKDQLTICVSEEGGARPKKIDANAYGLLVFKRMKK